jgi:threonine/homoserine/homoserine lactone efflux protein
VTVLSALLGFGVVAALLTIVPGVDTALIIRSAASRGRRYAASVTLGILTGCLLWGFAAAEGASALLAASRLAYEVLAYAGAAYLVFLGVQLIYKTFRGQPTQQPDEVSLPGKWRAYLTGLTTNLLNPKIGVFYIATIPQFTPSGVNPLLMGVALAGVHVLLGLVWWSVLIFAASLAGRWLRSTRAMKIFDRVTGTVLIGVGIRIALSRPGV